MYLRYFVFFFHQKINIFLVRIVLVALFKYTHTYITFKGDTLMTPYFIEP